MLLTCAYLSGCVSMLCVHTHLSAQLLLCKSDPIVQLLLCRLHPIVHCSGNAVNRIFLKSIWTKAWFDKIGKPELAALACYCCSMAIPQQWQQPTLFFLAIVAFYIVHCLYFCLVYIYICPTLVEIYICALDMLLNASIWWTSAGDM